MSRSVLSIAGSPVVPPGFIVSLRGDNFLIFLTGVFFLGGGLFRFLGVEISYSGSLSSDDDELRAGDERTDAGERRGVVVVVVVKGDAFSPYESRDDFEAEDALRWRRRRFFRERPETTTTTILQNWHYYWR